MASRIADASGAVTAEVNIRHYEVKDASDCHAVRAATAGCMTDQLTLRVEQEHHGRAVIAFGGNHLGVKARSNRFHAVKGKIRPSGAGTRLCADRGAEAKENACSGKVVHHPLTWS